MSYRVLPDPDNLARHARRTVEANDAVVDHLEVRRWRVDRPGVFQPRDWPPRAASSRDRAKRILAAKASKAGEPRATVARIQGHGRTPYRRATGTAKESPTRAAQTRSMKICAPQPLRACSVRKPNGPSLIVTATVNAENAAEAAAGRIQRCLIAARFRSPLWSPRRRPAITSKVKTSGTRPSSRLSDSRCSGRRAEGRGTRSSRRTDRRRGMPQAHRRHTAHRERSPCTSGRSCIRRSVLASTVLGSSSAGVKEEQAAAAASAFSRRSAPPDGAWPTDEDLTRLPIHLRGKFSTWLGPRRGKGGDRCPHGVHMGVPRCPQGIPRGGVARGALAS